MCVFNKHNAFPVFKKKGGGATCVEMCVHSCVQARVRAWMRIRLPHQSETRTQSPRQPQKGQRACLCLPDTKNNPRAEELFNDKHPERLRPRPTPSPSAQGQAKPKITLLSGGVGEPQPNKETRAPGAARARGGRRRGALLTPGAPHPGGPGARARTRTHAACMWWSPSRNPAPG